MKANGRIKPLSVLAAGKEKHHPEARYKVSLHNGANIRQIQKWLGHHPLDVTPAYLADEGDTSEPVREQVNSAFFVFAPS